jgi:hypothetical protein
MAEIARSAMDEAVSKPTSCQPVPNATEDIRTETEQHANRIHLPRLIYGPQDWFYHSYHAASAMYRVLPRGIKGQTPRLESSLSPSILDSIDEEVGVDTSYEKEEARRY